MKLLVVSGNKFKKNIAQHRFWSKRVVHGLLQVTRFFLRRTLSGVQLRSRFPPCPFDSSTPANGGDPFYSALGVTTGELLDGCNEQRELSVSRAPKSDLIIGTFLTLHDEHIGEAGSLVVQFDTTAQAHKTAVDSAGRDLKKGCLYHHRFPNRS